MSTDDIDDWDDQDFAKSVERSSVMTGATGAVAGGITGGSKGFIAGGTVGVVAGAIGGGLLYAWDVARGYTSEE